MKIDFVCIFCIFVAIISLCLDVYVINEAINTEIKKNKNYVASIFLIVFSVGLIYLCIKFCPIYFKDSTRTVSLSKNIVQTRSQNEYVLIENNEKSKSLTYIDESGTEKALYISSDTVVKHKESKNNKLKIKQSLYYTILGEKTKVSIKEIVIYEPNN